jgi:hypothetical protein
VSFAIEKKHASKRNDCRINKFTVYMRPNKTDIVIASWLIVAFTVFNVGIPIVFYPCPMMRAANPHCAMMPSAPDGTLSITFPVPDCCKSRIIAEGNTIPYLSVEHVKLVIPLPLDQLLYATNESVAVNENELLTHVSYLSLSPPFSDHISRYLLNLSLLI